MRRAVARFPFAPALMLALILSLAPLPIPPAAANEPGNLAVSDFFGSYEGRTLFPMGEQGNRGLKVTIREHDTFGFTVLWETSIPKGSGEAKRKATSITFKLSTRPHIFEAAHAPGGAPSLIDGDSFAWARIKGKTLTVHVLTIVDGGDYVMQSYNRTLTTAGLQLEFTRLRDGVVERQLKGNLNRIEPTEQPTTAQ